MAHVKQRAQFIEDQWQVTDRLLVNPSLRKVPLFYTPWRYVRFRFSYGF